MYEGAEVFGVPTAEKPDRLQLALILDEGNPLTARVVPTVGNPSGTGIVRQFGSQGELLTSGVARLAGHRVGADEVDTKAFLKLVTSAAYQQDSRSTPEHLENDPPTALRAWPALAVDRRDDPRSGDVRQRPAQRQNVWRAGETVPAELWCVGGVWSGYGLENQRGRISIAVVFTPLARTNPYPSMAAFDAPNRNVCTVRRVPTNTPLQALVTMNDPVYVGLTGSGPPHDEEGGDTAAAR